MKCLKKIMALMLSCAMALTVIASGASAYDFSADVYADNAPTETVKVNNSVLSGATAAANTTALSFLGINVTSTDAAGAMNSAGDPTKPVNLLVFGSALNENADPYLWNFYCNLNKYGYPGDVYDINAYSDWEGDYTLLNDSKSGPTGSATSSSNYLTPIDVNGTYKYCNPLFFYEPDVLMGSSSDSYDYGLDIYKLMYNPNYNPLRLGGWNTSEYCLNDGTFASTTAMANGVYTMAKEIQDAYGTTKVSRYNNGNVVQCGVDYSNFALGVYYYVQSRLYPNTSLVSSIKEAGYCTGVSISDSGEITVTNAYEDYMRGRYLQYVDGIAHQVDTGTVYQDYGKLKDDVQLIIMDTSQLSDSQKRMLTQVNVKYVDINSIMPQTVYGTTMQSADNILGVPYFVGLLYEGKLSTYSTSLSEYDYTAYFIENLYHVNNKDVETVLDAMVGDGCGSGYTGLNRSYNYNDLINSMIEIGAAYYKDEFLGSGLWQAVDDGLF